MGQAFECNCHCGTLTTREDTAGTAGRDFTDTWLEVLIPDYEVSSTGRAFVQGPYHFAGVEHLGRFMAEDRDVRAKLADAAEWAERPHVWVPSTDEDFPEMCGKCGLREDEEPHVSGT